MPRTSRVDLPGCPRFRALCCDSLGLIKVVEAEGGSAPKVVARWGNPDLRQGIRCVSLSSDASPRLSVARRTNTVEILDPAMGTLQSLLVLNPAETPGRTSMAGSDDICGLHLFSEDIPWGPSVLTCTEYGDASLNRISSVGQGEGLTSQGCARKEASMSKWNISQTGSVSCMKVDGQQQHAVFGGKGVDVNVWDLVKKSKLWSGKAPHRDSLGLISPAWVTAVTFLSKHEHKKIVVGTGHHQVRLYDIGAQRRPVLAFDYGESPIMAIAEDPDGNSVYLGTGSGDLACFDMRTGRLVGGFKGKCAGSIRSVVRHQLLPLIASCGLDRYLRIHNTRTRELLGSLFLKQQLVSVVFDVENNMSTNACKSETARSQLAIIEEADEFHVDGGVNRSRNISKRMKVERAAVEQIGVSKQVIEHNENNVSGNRFRKCVNGVEISC